MLIEIVTKYTKYTKKKEIPNIENSGSGHPGFWIRILFIRITRLRFAKYLEISKNHLRPHSLGTKKNCRLIDLYTFFNHK